MEKYKKLIALLKRKKSVAIAFSGGVDSGLVAKAAMDAGIDTIAITIISPLITRRQIKEAKSMAAGIGIKHVFIRKRLSDAVKKNDRMRCYYCKKEDAKLLKKFAMEYGYEVVADGINASDEYIGKIACDEEGIWHPLVEADIKKDDIRRILKKIGVDLWKKMPDSCLATRVQYGTRLEESLLRKIEKGEDFLLKYFGIVRLRVHDNIARIEIGENEFSKIFELRKEIIEKIKKLGFKYVTIDLEGYRKGSMN